MIENFFCQAKKYRRVSTRYDKLQFSFLAFATSRKNPLDRLNTDFPNTPSTARKLMQEPPNFHLLNGYAEYRCIGQTSINEMAHLITSAISFARHQKIKKLLIDTRGLARCAPPDIATRFFFIKEWAGAANGLVKVALVARPEMIDPEKFGTTVAINRGFNGDIFASEIEALSWLLASAPGESLPERPLGSNA